MQPKNLAGMLQRLVPTIDTHRGCQRRAYEDSRDITLDGISLAVR